MKGFSVFLALIVAAVASVRDNECPPEQEHDWTIEKLLRHEDCDKFYKCTYGQPVEKQCPSGLWFCLENWRCEWPHLVDCTGRYIPGQTTTTEPTSTTTTTKPTQSTTTTTTSTTTTTTPTPTPTTTTPTTTTTTTTTASTPPSDFGPNGCPVNQFIHWLLPHETNCNWFYYCVWGQRVLRACPAGLHFNREIQVCDWPRDAGCA